MTSAWLPSHKGKHTHLSKEFSVDESSSLAALTKHLPISGNRMEFFETQERDYLIERPSPDAPPSFDAGVIVSSFFASEEPPQPQIDADYWGALRTRWRAEGTRHAQNLYRATLREMVQRAQAEGRDLGVTPLTLYQMAAVSIEHVEGCPTQAALELWNEWLAIPKLDFSGAPLEDFDTRIDRNNAVWQSAAIAQRKRADLVSMLSLRGFAESVVDSWCDRMTGIQSGTVNFSATTDSSARALPVAPEVLAVTAAWLVKDAGPHDRAQEPFFEFRQQEWQRARKDVERARTTGLSRLYGARPWFAALRQAAETVNRASPLHGAEQHSPRTL
jgi:hypothetical protein